MLNDILINLAAGFIFLILYEFLFKNLFIFCRNQKFSGKYFHCDMYYNIIKTEGLTHYSDIKIKFFNPHVLYINAFDNDRNLRRIWKGKIKIDADTGLYGFGTYKYEDGSHMGIHDILILDDDTISFQLSYYKTSYAPYLMVKQESKKLKQ